jgi:protoporphyrinogen oxidase
MLNIGIIGAGPAGLAAAYDLAKSGHKVTIYEGQDRVGGLASGFKDAGWDWELEKFYHHWFQTDHALLKLAEELGIREQIIFKRPKTSYRVGDKNYQLDSPTSALLYPALPFWSKIPFGFATIFLKAFNTWKTLEKTTADKWLSTYMGKPAYELIWKPLLIGKFGAEYQNVNMAWMWARLHTRTTQLGTFEGGFQRFLDIFAQKVQGAGAQIRFNAPVESVRKAENGKGFNVTANGQSEHYDAVISTTSPALMLKIAPEITGDYAEKLRKLRSIGAVCVVVASKHSVLTDGTYWLNLPATSADKRKNPYPFLALVEHTNFLPAEHYNGDRLLYLGDYVPADHEYFQLSDQELADRFMATLPRFNPDFKPDWVRKVWVWRAPYAQPVPYVNHSANIPDLQTSLPGLYLASMSQVYPYDRGTNYAIEMGREVAQRVMKEV